MTNSAGDGFRKEIQKENLPETQYLTGLPQARWGLVSRHLSAGLATLSPAHGAALAEWHT